MDDLARRLTGAFAVGRRSLAVGLIGSGLMSAAYLGLITLAQGADHALAQLRTDLVLVMPVVLAFGVQLALFAELRAVARIHRASALVTVGATGTSGAAMLACCAHHLIEVLPFLGLAAAAVVLNEYRETLFVLGMVMNGLGIAFLARHLAQARHACPTLPVRATA